MTISKAWFCAVLSVLGLAAVAPGAQAQSCPAGTYECGADYCTPSGGVCCAGVGRPDAYCPGGTTCTTDGSCAEPGDDYGSGGGDYGSGGGATCPAGTYACGADYCTPNDGVCCASVGRPDQYCPAGSACTADGQCSGSDDESGSGSGSGGGTAGGVCPAGSYACGDGYCVPEGGVCCASAGWPGQYCPNGTACTVAGQCASAQPDYQGVQGVPDGGGEVVSAGSTDLTCAPYYDDGYADPQAQAECKAAYGQVCVGNYDSMATVCDALSLLGGDAEARCPYCAGVAPRVTAGADSGDESADDSNSRSGCSAVPGRAHGTAPVLVLTLLGAAVLVRRRRGA